MTHATKTSQSPSEADLTLDSVSTLARRVFELGLLVSRLSRALGLLASEEGFDAKWRCALADAAIQEKVIALEMAMHQCQRLKDLGAPAVIIEEKEHDVALLKKTIVEIKEAVASGAVGMPCTQVFAEGTIDDLMDLTNSFAGSDLPLLVCDSAYRRRMLSR